MQLEIASGYLMAGDIDRAVELLEKMPEGGASDLQREYLLVAALLRKGDNDKAVAEVQALVERNPSDPRARNLAAGVFAATGKTDAARTQFKEALKLKPNDAGTLVNLARLDLADGKAADAEQGFRKVLATDPKHLVATVGVAVAAGAQGNTKEAEKWLQQASTDHPDSVEAQMTLAQFYLGTRDFGKAKAVIDAAAQKAPDNAALANARGLAQVGLNDLPGALASFKQATTLAPKAYGYALNLARGHLANRDLTSTLDVLNAVLKSEPKYLPALALAAAVNLQAGEVEKATGYVERLRTAAPDAPGTFVLEGDLAMAQKRYGDALQFYRRANATSATSQLVLAQYRAAVLSGDKSAEQLLEEWVAKNPNDAGVVAVLADVRQRKGDVDGAIKLYEQSLAKAPDNAVLLNNLAVLYDGKGNPKALELAERAYKLAPKAAAIQDTYGWILFKRDPSDKSLQLLREASQGMPNTAEVQYHYAAALAKRGDTAEAVELLKKAVYGQMPPDQKADAKKLLEQLVEVSPRPPEPREHDMDHKPHRTRRIAPTWTLALAAVASLFAGCASGPEVTSVAAPAVAQAEQSEYRIGPGDTLQVFVWNQPELTVTVPVRPDGMISTPLIAGVPAEGKTASAARQGPRGGAVGVRAQPHGERHGDRLRRRLRRPDPRRRPGLEAAVAELPRQHDAARRDDRGGRPGRVRVRQQGRAGAHRERPADPHHRAPARPARQGRHHRQPAHAPGRRADHPREPLLRPACKKSLPKS